MLKSLSAVEKIFLKSSEMHLAKFTKATLNPIGWFQNMTFRSKVL